MRRTARNRCVALIAVMVVWLLGVGAQATTGLIAFSTDRDGVSEIYVVRPDGTGLRNLTRSPAREGIAMWSPARRQLAFWSDRDGESGIYTMNADGSGVRKLFTMPPDTYYWAWAPDGRNFAFTSRRDGNQDIYVMGFDGGPWRNISDHPATLEYGTAWSPDSRRVAFTSNRDGPRRIYAVDADGRNPEWIVDPGGVEEDPAWSPDGRRLAFLSRRRDHFHTDVWVADLGGGNARNLTPAPDVGEPERDSARPAWSPDGRKIAYGSRPLNRPDPNYEIFVTTVEDPDPTNLTEHPARDWRATWFDPRGLGVSPVDMRPFTWGWIKQLGATGL